MKKSISIILVMTIILGIFAMCGVTAFAENDIMNYITYEIDDYYGGVVITSCDPSISGDVVIPNTIEGQPVKVIDMYAFAECDGITSVYIPENIIEDNELFNFFYGGFGLNVEKYIVDENNSYYFSDDDGIVYNKDKTKLVKCPCGKDNTEYAIPDSVNRIGAGAFMYCSSLINVTIPDSVENLEPQAFLNCSSLENIEIPDSVKYMDYGMFTGCSSLKTVVIGDGVKCLYSSFEYCISLETIEIGSSVEELDSFALLPSLKSITVAENNPNYSSVDGYLLSKDGTKLITYPMGKGSSCQLPDCVTTIYMTSIVSYFLKDIDLTGISEIEEMSFYGDFGLESVEIPETIGTLKTMTFLDCYNMKDVYVYNPDMVFEDYSVGYMVYRIIIDVDEYTELYKGRVNSKSYEEEQMYQNLIDAAIVYDDNLYPMEDLTIHGYAGSTAETYANENGFKFVPICKHNYVDTVITPATYTQSGVGGMVCEHCGDVQSTYEIPMLEIEDSEEEKDEDTGVSVIFPDGTFDEDAEIEITPVEEGEAYKLISHKQGNYKVTMFDINVTVDGQKVQPNGTVLVRIPLPKGYNQNKCVVYYVADDGTMEELKTYHYKDGYVYFETDHFSYYAVIEDVEESENAPDEELSFIEKVIAFINMIIDFFKQVFGIA